ncbi:MAG: beta-lactamase family protein [Bacteroidetes bacterium]|nr:beta-lactamase family protein [Bacteroidota bacterium]MBS1541432.1 beta-lactamase family protein [Bacteroidota bacterium]
MKASILFLLVIVFMVQCTPRKETSSVKTLSQRIDSIMTTVPDFSGVVLVADRDKPIYHKAFGYTHRETKQPMDTSAVFELASVSKQFTAMLIAMLSEEGKLHYDDAIKKYLPGLPYPNITIRHLLNHTSGLPDYQKLMDEKWDKSKVANNDDIIFYLKKFHPASLFNPGEKYEYSNTGYVLLGSIVEKVSGKDFITFAHEKIFDPLQMKNTDIRSKAQKDQISNFARGYTYAEDKKRYILADSFPSSNYTIWLGGRKGPGRVSSTSSDLLKWSTALNNAQIVSEKTLNEIYSTARLNDGTLSNYGFGWMLKMDSTLGKVVYHTGDNPGYKTEIFRCLDCHKTIIVLCNNAHPQFENMMKALVKQL